MAAGHGPGPKRRTRTFPPNVCLPTDQRTSFGYGGDLDWLPRPPDLPPGVDPAQAVSAAMWQHLVAYGISTAMKTRGWNLKEFASKTPGIGYTSWDNVLNGRTLIRSDHIGAAGLVFGSLGFLPPAKRDADHRRAHARRLANFADGGEPIHWTQYESLQSGWEDLRRLLARPFRDREHGESLDVDGYTDWDD